MFCATSRWRQLNLFLVWIISTNLHQRYDKRTIFERLRACTKRIFDRTAMDFEPTDCTCFACCSVYNFEKNKKERKYLGVYDTQEEAFEVYKEFKERYIKKVADYYKDKIPDKLYQALYNYEVEITD